MPEQNHLERNEAIFAERIKGAATIEELKNILQEQASVVGSQKTESAHNVIKTIEFIEKGAAVHINEITRNNGLRAKVIELLHLPE